MTHSIFDRPQCPPGCRGRNKEALSLIGLTVQPFCNSSGHESTYTAAAKSETSEWNITLKEFHSLIAWNRAEGDPIPEFSQHASKQLLLNESLF